MGRGRLVRVAGAAFALVAASPALADEAETRGGIRVVTDDGRFEARVGGRIHFDGALMMEDEEGSFGSPGAPSQSGFYFRRILLGMNGKAYGWKYKVEADFANEASTGATRISFEEAWFGTALGPGEIQLGQRRPFRGMEDLAGNNATLMLERPFASSSGGMFAGEASREFQSGVFYQGNGERYTWGVGLYSLRALNTPGTEGFGGSARYTLAPLLEEGRVLHLGVSLSDEHADNNQAAFDNVESVQLGAGNFAYGGFRGPRFDLGATAGSLATAGVELAGAFGSFYAQAEAMFQKQLRQSDAPDQDILAWYLQGSWFVTGESRPYRRAVGVFGNPLPNSPNGAWEIALRVESAAAADPGYSNSSCLGSADTACEVSAMTLGVNYYVTPNVRFMLNYLQGAADRGLGGTDEPSMLAARAQMAW